MRDLEALGRRPRRLVAGLMRVLVVSERPWWKSDAVDYGVDLGWSAKTVANTLRELVAVGFVAQVNALPGGRGWKPGFRVTSMGRLWWSEELGMLEGVPDSPASVEDVERQIGS